MAARLRARAQPRRAGRLLAADPALAERLLTTWIDHTERGGERPSDHAAVFAEFDASPNWRVLVRER